MVQRSIMLPETTRKEAKPIGTPASTTRRKAIRRSFTMPQTLGIWYALRKPSIQEIMTPDAVHKVRMLVDTRNLVCTGLAPVMYCAMVALVPSGRMRPMARKISRTNSSLLRERDRMEASTRMAGKNVRIAENAAPLATPKASCSKARQNAIRNCWKNRDISSQNWRQGAIKVLHTLRKQGRIDSPHGTTYRK